MRYGPAFDEKHQVFVAVDEQGVAYGWSESRHTEGAARTLCQHMRKYTGPLAGPAVIVSYGKW